MGKKDYSISTSLTGDSGEAFLATLTDAKRKRITDLVNLQRQDLDEIVKTRRAIATELRRFLKGESAYKDKVLSLSKRYGELDGDMSYLADGVLVWGPDFGRLPAEGRRVTLAAR